VIASTPALISPGEGATSPTTRPALTFSTVPYAQRYRIDIYDVTADRQHTSPFDVTAPANNDTLTQLAYTVDYGRQLAAGKRYRWRVLASNERGDTAYSAPVTFDVSANPSRPTGAVTIDSPAGGVLDQPLRPTFGFRYTAPDAGTISGYQLQVMKCGTTATVTCSSTFTITFVEEIVTTETAAVSYTLRANTLFADQLYAYRIVPRNAIGLGTAPAMVRALRTLPQIPRLVAPTGAVVETMPTFRWVAVPATTFDVLIKTDPNFGGTAHPASRTGLPGSQLEYTPTVPLEPGAYYWRVKSNGPTFESFIGRFRVTGPLDDVPLAPSNLAPTGPVGDGTPTLALTWSDPGPNNRAATEFFYEVRDGSGALVVSGTVFDTRATIAMPARGAYTFTARGANVRGQGEPSAPASFTITAPPTTPAIPVLQTPANNATGVVPAGLTFTWRDPGHGTPAAATSFRFAVRLSQDITPEFPVILNVGDAALVHLGGGVYSYTLTEAQAALLLPGVRHNWQVGAKNGAIGYYRNSGLLYFTTAR
jgi:hypothetical protein